MTALRSQISKNLNNLCNKLNGFCGFLGGVIILILAFIVTYEIIMRSLFNSPTDWVLEVSIYLCLASVFITAGYTHSQKGHIYVDLFINRLSRRDRIVVEFFTSILGILYVMVFIWEGGKFAINSFLMNEVSPTVLKVPIVLPAALVPIGGALLMLELLRGTFSLFFEIKTDLKECSKEIGCPPRGVSLIIFFVLFVLCIVMLFSKGLVFLGLFILLFLLLFSGMPVAFAMGLIGALGFFSLFGGFPMLVQIPLVAYKTLDDFIMVAVPLFIMTSTVMMIGKIGEDLFEVASKWIRHLPGGLAVAAIFACTIFAAISGSSSATVATIGIIALPQLISRGYPRDFSYGTIAIGGVLGPLIPPSIFMIIIGSMSGDSVGKLFMAGMLPGIMLAIIFSVYIVVRSIKDKSIPKIDPSPWKERWVATTKAFWGILTPVIILGGIYTGIFTPTEAAGIGVTYGLFISIFFYRSISFKELYIIIMDSAKLNCMILFIVVGSMIFGQFIAMIEAPQIICNYLAKLPFTPMTILWIVILFIFILGALMDELSILLITYPILYQIFVKHFGFDSIWFSLVFVFALEVGFVVPPVGLNLFVVQGIDNTSRFEEIVKGVWPFVVLLILSTIIVVYFKPLSLWLPGLIG